MILLFCNIFVIFFCNPALLLCFEWRFSALPYGAQRNSAKSIPCARAGRVPDEYDVPGDTVPDGTRNGVRLAAVVGSVRDFLCGAGAPGEERTDGMKHGDLFPIGAVAKLYHISVGTLRLYEPSDMELPIQRLVKGRNRDMVFLGKVGIEGVESNLGTAIRTGVVLVMSWMMVFVTGKGAKLREVPKGELGFICLSGLATGGSWLCYYKALQDGPASVVAPIDKLSILVTILFSYLVFHEKLTKKAALGLTLVVAGTLLMLL